MIRAAENAKSYKRAGSLRNPKSLRDRLFEMVPEDWAFDPLEENVDQQPDSPQAWFELGEEERERGYFRDALASYQKAIELKKDIFPIAFLRSGEACFALSEYNAAVKQSTKAIAQDPELVEAYTLRASAYERMLNYEEAIKDHNVALVLKGQPVRAKAQRSLTSELVGKAYNFLLYNVARRLYQKTEAALRSPLVQQRLGAMRASVAKNFRDRVEKVKPATKTEFKSAPAVGAKAKKAPRAKAKAKAAPKAKAKARAKAKVAPKALKKKKAASKKTTKKK